ncbi:MAG: sulfate ABC transporter substrate-binding protein [bacterium]
MKKTFAVLMLFLVMTPGCSNQRSGTVSKEATLTLGAYTVVKEVYQREIIPSFKEYWKKKTGEEVRFEESYIASGAQSRAIAGGFEADVAALSLAKDVNRLKEAGLITHDWKANPYQGFVTRSVVVIAHRPGNPKKIRNWIDLTRREVEVLYPSPKTSGGAMWCVNAIYGAGLKLTEKDTGNPDADYARWLLKSIQKQVKVMDKSGRASVTTFENGVGDALVTYENEAKLRQKEGKEFPFIIPDETILIENPAALIDVNVDKHNNRRAAEAFVEFLWSERAQSAFAQYGFRPLREDVEERYAAEYPVPPHLFDIQYLGGWDEVEKNLFSQEGVWGKIVEEIARNR